MTDTTVNAAVETTTATETTKAVKPAKKATKKAVKPAKKAAKKAVKPAAKKAAKKAVKPAAKKTATKKAAVIEAAPRKSSTFKPTTKKVIDGEGQRAQIMTILQANGGATRHDVMAELPEVSAANISWHLSMLVKDGLVKKIAA